MNKYSVILNLTQHKASKEQIEVGVTDLPNSFQEQLKELLTFNKIPNCQEIKKRAGAIYDLVIDFCLSDYSPVRDEVKKMILDDSGDFGSKYQVNEKEFKKLNFGFMIGGALWLMKPLIEELENIGTPFFAFTKRVVDEVKQDDGTVKKISVFKHEGFIVAC